MANIGNKFFLLPMWIALFAKINHFLQTRWRTVVIAIPYLWLIFFFLIPFFIVLKISFAELLIASPPFLSLFE